MQVLAVLQQIRLTSEKNLNHGCAAMTTKRSARRALVVLSAALAISSGTWAGTAGAALAYTDPQGCNHNITSTSVDDPLALACDTQATATGYATNPSTDIIGTTANDLTGQVNDNNDIPTYPWPDGLAEDMPYGLDLSGNYLPVAGATGTGAATALISPCHIDTGYAYLRTSLQKNGVGFKPTTSCSVPAQSISMVSQLYKRRFFGLFSGAQGAPSGSSNSGQSTLTDRKVGVNCTNTKSTVWYGVTRGVVVIAGVTYTAAARTPDATLNCGT